MPSRDPAIAPLRKGGPIVLFGSILRRATPGGKESRAMAYEYILSKRLEGVAVITLNRPEKLNALSFPLMQEVEEALNGYEADDDIKAVVITGAGERAFSAGA